MPRIPIIQAESPAAVQRLPARLPVPDYTGLGQAGQAFEQFGQQLHGIGAKLQEQQNELDTAKLVGEFSGKVKEIEANLRYEEKDPLKWSKVFTEKVTELQNEMVSTASNKLVAKAFTQHVGRHLPLRSAEVHANALKWMGQQQTADMEDALIEMRRQAITAQNPAERDEWTGAARALIKRNPHDNPEEKQKRDAGWMKKTQYDWARLLLDENPEKFDVEEKKGSFAEVDARDLSDLKVRADARNAARVKTAMTAKDKAMDVWREGVEIAALEHQQKGTLTQEFIDDYKPWLVTIPQGSAIVKSWQTVLTNQELGNVPGNPDIMRRFQSDVYDLTKPAQSTLRDLISVNRVRGNIDGREFTKWASHLAVRIREERQEGKGDADEARKLQKEFDKRQGEDVIAMAELRLPFTGVDKVDRVANALLGRFREIMATKARSRGYGMADMEVYRTYFPGILAQMDDLLTESIRQLLEVLGQHKDQKLLFNAKDALSPLEFEEKYRALEELQRLRAAQERVTKSRKEAGK